IDPAGRIVAAGTTGFAIPGVDTADFAVAAFNLNGSLDPSFGSGGRAVIDFGTGAGKSIDIASAVAFDAAGRIVLAGEAQQGSTALFDFAVARLNVNGSLDPSFDGDGRATVHFEPATTAGAGGVALDAAGRVVLAGHSGATFVLAR